MLRKAGRQQEYQTRRQSPWQGTPVKNVHIDHNISIDPPFPKPLETLEELWPATIQNLTSEQCGGSNGERKRNHQDQESHTRPNDRCNRIQHVMNNSDTREPFMSLTEKANKPAPKIRFDTISQDRSGDCERLMLLYALRDTGKTQTLGSAKVLRSRTLGSPEHNSLAGSKMPAANKVKATEFEAQEPNQSTGLLNRMSGGGTILSHSVSSSHEVTGQGSGEGHHEGTFPMDEERLWAEIRTMEHQMTNMRETIDSLRAELAGIKQAAEQRA